MKKLKVRLLNLDAGGKTIAIINSRDAVDFGVRPLERIVLTNPKNGKKLTAVVNVTDKFVKPGEIIVYDEIKEILNLKNGMIIKAEPRPELISKQYIRKKIDGCELSYNEMKAIVKDVLERNLNDLELAAFITALHINGMTLDENVYFSKVMVESGKRLKFRGTVVDKHSVGGVPGDKTSLLLVPIIASSGLKIPKTSSRSITSPAGTADRAEILMPVELNATEIKRVVNKTNGCLVWGGAVDLAPADDLFIQIENPLNMDPLVMPSVMSKKKSVGAKHVVIDIPVGDEAKIKTEDEAEHLAKNFIELGKELSINVDCVLTQGDQPIGHTMGPALEAREVLQTIHEIETAPDLVDKVATIAGKLFEMTKKKGGKKLAYRILKSGKAEKKLRQIIKAQGGNPKIKPEDIKWAKEKKAIRAKKEGVVINISNKNLAMVAKTAGAPKDKLAGILLNKKVGDFVKRNEILYTIYAERKNKLREALRVVDKNAILISKNRRMLIKTVR